VVWCGLRGLDPLAASRPHVELYVRWLQEVRRHRPRHADPRTIMRYDRARNNLDRHVAYILAAYMASGT
jgi:hypothetical protein